VAITQAYL